MPDTNERHESNVKGPLFVDRNLCGGCRACKSHAPKNFRVDDNLSAYVYKQPSGDREIAACQKALEDCPNLAIGKEDDPEPKSRPPARRH